MSDELFTKQMSKATRKVHAVSDALVNTKLLFALNNNSVWAEGLLIFYEIFKFLEQAMKDKEKEHLGKLNLKEMNRTAAFEEDLSYYLGKNWKKNYKVRESVKNYLNHLENLLETDSDLLMAYVYHLYMGLLSGGQILMKKRNLKNKLTMSCEKKEGEAVTDFKNQDISALKSKLKGIMNSIADELSEDKKNALIRESMKVFELNNSIIKTVQGAESVAFKNLSVLVSCIVLVIAIVYYYSRIFFQ